MSWRAALPLIVLLVLVGFFAIGLTLDPTQIESPLIDQPAPEYRLATVRDTELSTSLSDFRGEVVLVNVWGSWCVGCRIEHEVLMAIHAAGELRIVGINWKDELDAARHWLDRTGDPYVVSGWDYSGDVAIDFGVYGAPESFLVDAEGRIRFKHIGPLTHEVVRDEIMPRVRQLRGDPG